MTPDASAVFRERAAHFAEKYGGTVKEWLARLKPLADFVSRLEDTIDSYQNEVLERTEREE